MIPERKIGRIQALFDATHNASHVARTLGISRATVSKYVALGASSTSRYKSRPVSSKVQHRLKLVALLAKEVVTKNGRTWPLCSSALQVQRLLAARHHIHISRRQCHRDLRRCGLRSYVRPAVPTRRTEDRDRRKAFARKQLLLDHKRLAFSDESWLTCNELTGRNQWAKKRSDVLPRERRARWNVASVMVWATFGHNYRSELVVFPAKRGEKGEKKPFRMDSRLYIRHCLASVARELTANNKTLVHDGARSHASKQTTQYLQRKKISYLKDFPPYSPDLNMIEPLWKTLAERVGAYCPATVAELSSVAKKVWREMPIQLLNSHAAHFPTALKVALLAK